MVAVFLVCVRVHLNFFPLCYDDCFKKSPGDRCSGSVCRSVRACVVLELQNVSLFLCCLCCCKRNFLLVSTSAFHVSLREHIYFRCVCGVASASHLSYERVRMTQRKKPKRACCRTMKAETTFRFFRTHAKFIRPHCTHSLKRIELASVATLTPCATAKFEMMLAIRPE